MELIKDYDCVIDYHPGKANVVTDTLSRKSMQTLRALMLIFVNRRRYSSGRIKSETEFVESSTIGTKER